MFSRQPLIPARSNTVGFQPFTNNNQQNGLAGPLLDLNKATQNNVRGLFNFPKPIRPALPVNDPNLEGYRKSLASEGLKDGKDGKISHIPNVGLKFLDDSYFEKIRQLQENAAFEDFKIWQLDQATAMMKRGPVARKYIMQHFPYLLEGIADYNKFRRDFENRLDEIQLYGLVTPSDHYLIYEMNKDPVTFKLFLQTGTSLRGDQLSKIHQIWRHIQLMDQVDATPNSSGVDTLLPGNYDSPDAIGQNAVHDASKIAANSPIEGKTDTPNKQTFSDPLIDKTKEKLPDNMSSVIGLPPQTTQEEATPVKFTTGSPSSSTTTTTFNDPDVVKEKQEQTTVGGNGNGDGDEN